MPESLLEARTTVHIDKGATLLEALSQAVSLEAGAVWLAVEAQDSCSFGVVTASEDQSQCLVQIGRPVTE